MSDYKSLLNECSQIIADQNLTIAFAESATAGKLAFEFSQTPHSGKILKGSLVCYDASVKESLLKIPEELIAEYTPESAEVTKEMAIRLRKLIDAEIIVSVTGLTTPGGSERPGKPVGTMFYCVLLRNEVIERRKIFTGSAVEIVDLTIEQIAKTILQALDTNKA